MRGEAWFGTITGREAGQAGWVVLPDGADHPYPNVPGIVNSRYTIGQRVKCVHIFGDPQIPQILEIGTRQWSILEKILGSWLVRRYDLRRSGNVGGGPVSLGTATNVNAYATWLLRALSGRRVQAGPAHVWIVTDSGETDHAFIWTQAALDAFRGRVYAIAGGHVRSYAISDVTGTLSDSSIGSLELEPLLLASGVWVAQTAATTASWTWTSLDYDALTTALATATMAWDGWGSASWPSHSSTSSFPIHLTRLPLFGREACVSQMVQPILLSAGVVPTEDSTFISELLAERDAPGTYDALTPHNYGCIASRSQLLCYDLPGASRIWHVDGWGTAEQYEGYTPVCATPTRLVAHWERATFSSVTGTHATRIADGDDYARLWGTPLGINTDHSLAPALDGDLQVNRTITFMSVTAGGGFAPWASTAPVPSWAYLRTEVDARTAEMLAYIEPTFGATFTRDFVSDKTHGLLALDAATGSETARIEFTTAREEYSSSYDYGEPGHYPHGEAPARLLYDGTHRLVTFTVSGSPGVTSLHELSGIDDDETIIGYTAVETFTGEAWLDALGGSHSIFFQGHVRYGGGVDVDGITYFSEPGTIYRNYVDPDGRWSHHTSSVEYSCWVVRRRTMTLQYATPKYGFDPRNGLTDGERVILLPRRALPLVTPMLQRAYYPPGTTFIADGLWNFQLPNSFNPVSSGIFPIESFFGAGWSKGPFLGAIFTEIQDVNLYYTTPRFAVYASSGWPACRGIEDSPYRGPEANSYYDIWSTTSFKLTHSTPIIDDMHESRVLNEYGNDSPWRWALHVPPYGYWYMGGDPLDPRNWRPVAYDSPGTLFIGRPGDQPSGGVYREATPPAPSIPYQDNPDLHAVVRAHNIGDMSMAWELDLGNLRLAATPCGLIAGGNLYLWVPGTVRCIDPATGTVTATLSIPGTAGWTDADLIAVDGRLILAGSTGRYDITA